MCWEHRWHCSTYFLTLASPSTASQWGLAWASCMTWWQTPSCWPSTSGWRTNTSLPFPNVKWPSHIQYLVFLTVAPTLLTEYCKHLLFTSFNYQYTSNNIWQQIQLDHDFNNVKHWDWITRENGLQICWINFWRLFINVMWNNKFYALNETFWYSNFKTTRKLHIEIDELIC